MMVKAHDTVVAHVAMRSSLWSEDVAGVAKFEFEQEGGVRLRNHQIVNSFHTTHLRILVWQVAACDVDPGAGRQDARVARPSTNHEQID